MRSIEAASDELGDLMRSPYHAAVATATTVKVAKQFFKNCTGGLPESSEFSAKALNERR